MKLILFFIFGLLIFYISFAFYISINIIIPVIINCYKSILLIVWEFNNFINTFDNFL